MIKAGCALINSDLCKNNDHFIELLTIFPFFLYFFNVVNFNDRRREKYETS